MANVFSCISSIKIWRKFVLKCQIDNRSAFACVMAWRWMGNKPIPKPMMTNWWYIHHQASMSEYNGIEWTTSQYLNQWWQTDDICITKPQWVNTTAAKWRQYLCAMSPDGTPDKPQCGCLVNIQRAPWANMTTTDRWWFGTGRLLLMEQNANHYSPRDVQL